MQPISSEFREYIGKQIPVLADRLADTLESTPPSVSIRLNPRKTGNTRPEIAADATSVPWWRNGVYLSRRPDFTHDPAMHQGIYYVQDASSMILAHVVETLVRRLREDEASHATPIRYLDACAAPGGKTTAAIDALPDGSFVLANEFDFRRAEILKENIMKWGYPSVAVSRGDTVRFRKLPGWFDIVAADVPCSGEGMMRKDETARTQWSTALVAECAARQREILQNLWTTLRPGGYLIYSTCTFNTVENEENIAWLIDTFGAIPVAIPLPEGSEGIYTSPTGAMRFLPTRLQGEGLFMAVVQKPGDTASDVEANPAPLSSRKKSGKAPRDGKPSQKGAITQAEATAICDRWLDGDFTTLLSADSINAVPAHIAPLLPQLQVNLDMIHTGIAVAAIKGRSIIPSQSLALSTPLRRHSFPMIETDHATAIAYLRRESLPGFDAPKGAVLLTYGGYPLGFANNLGNRANNLYPAQWRILH